MTEQELLRTISQLEKALGNIVDKADRVLHGTGGSNTIGGVDNSYSGKSPYGGDVENKNFERAREYI